MDVKKLSLNSFFLSFPYLIIFLLRLSALPFVLKAIPIEDYGKFQFSFALQEWAIAVTAINITAGMKRGLSKGLYGTLIFSSFRRFPFLLGVSVFFALSSLWIGAVLNKAIIANLFIIITFFMISGYIFQLTIIEFFVANKQFKQLAFWRILISSISIVGSAVVAYFTQNVIQFAVFQLGSITLLSLIGLAFILRRYNILDSYKKGEIDKECFSYGVKLIPVDLISLTAHRISHFIIGAFLGFNNLAVFSIASRLKDRTSELIKTCRALLYSDFAKLDKKELFYKANKIFPILVVISIISMSFLIFLGSFYIKYFLPSIYHKAIIYFIILGFSFPASILSIILQTMLEAHLRHKELTVTKVVPDIIRIFLILILGYLWKVIGICIGITLGMWCSLGFYYFFTLKKGPECDHSISGILKIAVSNIKTSFNLRK